MLERRIQFRGHYAFADRGTLEHALRAARSQVDEDALFDAGGWLRYFICRGTTLTLDVTVPASAEHRLAATRLFCALARDAIDGSVATVRGTGDVRHRVRGFAP